MGFVGIFMIRHNSWCEVLIATIIPDVTFWVSPMAAQEKTPIAQLIHTGVICVPLCPGDHQQTQAASQREAQDEGQRRPEHGQEG